MSVLEAYRDSDRVLRTDLRTYCKNMVKVLPKAGGQVVPFVWNEGQEILHAKIQAQLERLGRVRAIVLKARQLGVSTYTGARFYHKTSLNLGQRTYILTHEDKATQQLYGMAKRIHENMPPDYQPETSAANANEFDFSGMDSGYRIGTAQNTKGTGRSLTLQNFHGSEVAFWAQAATHMASVMEALSQAPGTESILESTANGVQGAFYEQWQLAERGQSDYLPIFLPWFIQSEYRRALDGKYEPSLEEQDYQRIYGLDDEQVCWMHYKNIGLGGRPGKLCHLYRQEYPANSAEAFQSTGGDGFISPELILAARAAKIAPQPYLPRVLGCDIARGGGDLTRLLDRQGRSVGKLINKAMDWSDLVLIANEICRILRDNADIVKAYIDVTGLGAGVYDVCCANGFSARVVPVNFGANAQDPERFVNRRAEIWWRGREWLMDPAGASIPDDDLAHRHIAAPGGFYDANSRFQLEKKVDIKKRVGFSPDFGDAWALTFSEHLAQEIPDNTPKWAQELEEEFATGWETA